MVVYNPMDAKERTTVRNAGFYAEFDESNSETSESEYNHINRYEFFYVQKAKMTLQTILVQ